MTGLIPVFGVCAQDPLREDPVRHADGQEDEQDIVPLGTILRHDHDPIPVQSKPVIERLPVKVIEPVDLRIARRGHLFVADRRAECVFRMETDGTVSLAVQRLQGIQRIHLDADDDLFVLTSTGGESAVHQFTRSGRHVILETMSFPSSAFTLDSDGELTIAVTDSGRLMSVGADGVMHERCVLPAVVRDIALNAGGQVEALLASGHVTRISNDGGSEFVGFAPSGSSRLMTGPDSAMLALQSETADRPGLVRIATGPDRPAEFQVQAHVPFGTKAAGFDALGNLCLVNTELRAVTRVTSRFLIPCPHCGRETLMIFSPKATETDPAAPETSRRF